jgi:hypothetical protein
MLSLGILDAFAARNQIPVEAVHWNLEEVRSRGLQAALTSKHALARNTNN